MPRGKTHYEDYLSIDPATARRRACRRRRGSASSGLDFNTTYNVTLKTGLPAAAGDKLLDEETVPVELRDKPSLVRFAGGIILPRDNADGVPVTTVNIAKLRAQDDPRRRPAAVADRKRHGRPDHALFLEATASSRTARARSSGRARWT